MLVINFGLHICRYPNILGGAATLFKSHLTGALRLMPTVVSIDDRGHSTETAGFRRLIRSLLSGRS